MAHIELAGVTVAFPAPKRGADEVTALHEQQLWARFVSGISANGSAFVARKGSGVKGWKDLAGKKIGTVASLQRGSPRVETYLHRSGAGLWPLSCCFSFCDLLIRSVRPFAGWSLDCRAQRFWRAPRMCRPIGQPAVGAGGSPGRCARAVSRRMRRCVRQRRRRRTAFRWSTAHMRLHRSRRRDRDLTVGRPTPFGIGNVLVTRS